jgi:diadenosine tetraphosphatase ApaH/serine/threonine PP2A family protein phosphatase
MLETLNTDAVQLDPTSTYIVNPGSVGQPRNGDPASSYIILDDVAQTITYRGVPYDILAAQDKIYDAMLPMPLAERLEIGR